MGKNKNKISREIIELALNNISKYGDTDIFPFPIEKLLFYDKKEECIDLIEQMDKNFNNNSKSPANINTKDPVNINTFVPLGYTGFRWATQIDPFWNVYFLSLVLSIADTIEENRIAKEKDIIYSYRFSPSLKNYKLFDSNYNWLKFQTDSLNFVKNNEEYKYIVICDIADFYNRIYHHPLENALDRLSVSIEVPKKIKKLIQKFSDTKSYGLPIGGEASRILAELALNSVDKLLDDKEIKFKRFVDDIHIFCKSLPEAHSTLYFLALTLMRNDGLTLQKHKTKIQHSFEFQKLVSSRINAESDNDKEKQRAHFMSLPINYDPYSDSADEDYDSLKNQLNKFDILGLLNDELRKVRVHQQFGKKLIKTFNVLEPDIISSAFDSIIKRFEILYPIFPAIMKSAYKNFNKLSPETKENLQDSLRNMVKNNSYIIQSEINMTYLLRVLGIENSEFNKKVITKVYDKTSDSVLVKSTIMQIMTRWKAYHWLSDKKDSFSRMNKWERRMFIVAANFLGDEGTHWLKHKRKEFSDSETLIMKWAKEKSELSDWSLPL